MKIFALLLKLWTIKQKKCDYSCLVLKNTTNPSCESCTECTDGTEKTKTSLAFFLIWIVLEQKKPTAKYKLSKLKKYFHFVLLFYSTSFRTENDVFI